MFTCYKLNNKFFTVLLIGSLIASCNKQDALTNDISTSSPTIAVAASLTDASKNAAVTDSVYLVQPCQRGATRDSIAQSDLPSANTSYLATNYTPYTYHKSFAITANSVITGYVAIIYYNDKPVGIQFDAGGNFVKVIEQREKGDLNGKGWHSGGRFGHRGHPLNDSVSLAELPAAVTQYLQSNYSTDTLLKAYKNYDSSYVILSKNVALFATIFSADGSFVSRTELTSGRGNCNSIAQTDLSAPVLSYLDASYPNYVFKKAYTENINGAIEKYIVFIDANNTKYALKFDSAGNFVASKTIN